MEWTALLKATIRLADTYDLARTLGSDSTNVGPEDRRSNTDGIWFALTTQFLSYLHAKDTEAPRKYHPIQPFFDQIKGIFPSVSLGDIKYLVNYLSKEIELKFYEEDSPSSIKASTPLVEKQQTGFRCRLSPNGLVTIGLSYGVEDLLYGEQIAWQIEKALKRGDFDKYLSFAEQLNNTVISQSNQVVQLLELTGRSELREMYRKNNDDYLETIEKIDSVISVIKASLYSEEVQYVLERYITENPEKEYYEYLLSSKIDIIRESLVGFKQNLSDLICHFYSLERSMVNTVNFQVAAIETIKGHVTDNQIDQILSLYGIWTPKNNVSSPPHEFYEKIILPPNPKMEETVFSMPPTANVYVDKLEQYIKENIEFIKNELAVKGAFSLSSVLDRLEELSYITEMANNVLGVSLKSALSQLLDCKVTINIQDNQNVKGVENQLFKYTDIIINNVGWEAENGS